MRTSRAEARTDAELLSELARGDLGTLGQLYDRHHSAIRDFLERVAHPADVDDLAHETFLTCARAASGFDGRESARPFLVGIAGQLVRRRRRSRQRLTSALAAFRSTIVGVLRRTPEDAAVESDDIARFERALRRLSEDKRLVFLMVERENMTGEEIGIALGIPTATVWTRLHHARRALRKSLQTPTMKGGQR